MAGTNGEDNFSQEVFGFNYIHFSILKSVVLTLFADMENRVGYNDFGWSVQSNVKRHTMCVTIDYLAPEMVEKKEHVHIVDVWTLWILCYEFLYDVPPFEAEDQYDTFQRIFKVDLKYPSTPCLSSEAKDLISKVFYLAINNFEENLDEVCPVGWKPGSCNMSRGKQRKLFDYLKLMHRLHC